MNVAPCFQFPNVLSGESDEWGHSSAVCWFDSFASVLLPFSILLFGLAVAAIAVHGKAMQALVAARDERSARAAAAAISEMLLQRSMTLMARRIHSAQQSLRRYIGKVTSAQEEERRRLAQDLHDETIQDLIALDQRVQLFARTLRAEKSRKIPGLEAIHREAQEAIQRVRRLSRALRPLYLEDLGLFPALEALANDVGSSIGIPVVVRAAGTPQPLPRDADLAVYRIVQEALANIARHAAAHQAWITLRYRRDELQVIVKDDGAGFTPPAEAADLSRTGHFGLIGMRERAQHIGALLKVHSTPGRGARVTVHLPLSTKRQNSRQ